MIFIGNPEQPRKSPFSKSSDELTCGRCGETRYPINTVYKKGVLVQATCPVCRRIITLPVPR